jgi:hypothetical protein
MTAAERVHGVDPLFALMLAGTVYVNRATACPRALRRGTRGHGLHPRDPAHRIDRLG